MRIGILSSEIPPEGFGGAELQAAEVATRLASRHDVCLFTRSRRGPPTLHERPRCRLYRRRTGNLPGLRFVLDLLHGLVLIGRQRRDLDVLLAYQTYIDGLIATLARVLFRVPVLVLIRSEQEYRLAANRKSRWLSPFVFARADRLAVQSPGIARAMIATLEEDGFGTLAGRVRNRLGVVVNGIGEPPPAKPVEDGDQYVLCVARLIPAKGVIHLVGAMRRCPGEQLIVVGDGPELPALQEAASDMDNVTFTGRVPVEEVPGLMRKAKLIVLPSLRDEGLPNVIMEAMRLGLPAVATRHAGVPDLIRDGETGLLVEPGDEDGLVRCIARLAGDPTLRQRLGAAGREEIRRYAWPRVLVELESELAQTLKMVDGPSSRGAHGIGKDLC